MKVEKRRYCLRKTKKKKMENKNLRIKNRRKKFQVVLLVVTLFLIFTNFSLISAETYSGQDDVYWEFQWETNNIKMQVRSCDDLNCEGEQFIGPDGTSLSYYEFVNNYTSNQEFERELGGYNELNVSNNNYFQYKAYLLRNSTLQQEFTPVLYDVDINVSNSLLVSIEKPALNSNYALEELDCVTKAQAERNVSVVFSWYLNNGFYKSETISDVAPNENVTSTISPGIPEKGEYWNCSVYAYHENGTSSNKSSEVTIPSTELYDSIKSVYYNFRANTQNTLLQIRSCDDSECSGESFIGPDNTSTTWFNNSLNTTLKSINIPENKYFQYKTKFISNKTIGQKFTPELYNVTINKTSGVNDTTPPTITWENPTPANGDIISNDYVYLNTTIIDDSDTSAFFDWNKSLIGYWSMDFYNSTGMFDNSSYNNFCEFKGNNFDINNITNGFYGNGLNFTGNLTGSAGDGTYLDCGNDSSLQPTDKMTIETWIRPKSQQETSMNYGVASSVQNWTGSSSWSWQIRYGGPTNNSLGFQLNTVDYGTQWVDLGYNLTTNEWYHIVILFNGTGLEMYVNGQINDTNNFGSTTIDTNIANKILIGNEGWANYFNGTIDEFKLYNRVLSPEEINASYNNGKYRLKNNFTELSNGDYNYSAYAIDTFGNLNITDERKITVSIDTCTCPGLNQNWEVDMSDYCVLQSYCNLGTGNLTFINTGNFSINATFKTKNMEYPSTGQTIYIMKNCRGIIG